MKLLYSFVAVAAIALSSCGSSDDKTEQPPFTAGDGTSTSKAASGEAIYMRTCVSCHMQDGSGMGTVYPPLAKSDYLGNKENAIRQLLKGSSGELVVNGKTYNNTMPPQQLNDEEIAAVLTYVYGSFGNSGGTVTPAEVKAAREK